MAQYDYRCKSCREVFTIERSMTAESTDCICEKCGSADVTRIWNAFIRTGGTRPDVGQGTKSSKTSSGGGCGSCSSSSCGTCH
ncbi:MAG: zinc ribbon domain-containing protein [Candidatus Melainabacteria bacterium]|nr:zinc ribbon domain-containing protein [Candidatus Melainabacteria bacterium]